MILSILILFALARPCQVHGSIDGALVCSISSLNLTEIREVGEIVDGYKLVERLQLLGLQSSYLGRPLWRGLLSPPPYFRSERQDSWFDNETLMKASQRCAGERQGNEDYCTEENIFHGGHGDVWRAHRIDKGGQIISDESYIMKRMVFRHRESIKAAALREIYFGQLLHHHPSFPRFITSFLKDGEYWLVFRDEGINLQSFLYTIESSNIFKPSKAWRRLRRTARGTESLKSILFQIIANVHELHSLNILHRDIKPANILLNVESKPRLLICDFSSAVLVDKVDFLYSGQTNKKAASIDEETLTYAPPEVILSMYNDDHEESAVPFDAMHPLSYDAWSIGVVFLELILGTADVFHVDQRTQVLITQMLRKKGVKNEGVIQKALFLAALADFCVYDVLDNNSTPQQHSSGDDASNSRKKGSGRSAAVLFARLLVEKLEERLALQPFYSTPKALPSSTSSSSSSVSLSSAVMIDDIEAVVPVKAEARNLLAQSKAQQTKRQPRCSLQQLSTAIFRRDILGLGYRDRWGLDLLSRLLYFDPAQRINMSEAMKHAFFYGPYVSEVDKSEHGTREEMLLHNAAVTKAKGSNSIGQETRQVNVIRTTTTSVADDGDARQQVDPLHLEHFHFDEDESSIYTRNNSNDRNVEDEYDDSSSQQQPRQGDIVFSSFDTIIQQTTFTCPKCKRKFPGNWQACRDHVHARRHGEYCLYTLAEDAIEEESGRGSRCSLSSDGGGKLVINKELERINTPNNNDVILNDHEQYFVTKMATTSTCLSTHSLFLPVDPQSGWCDLQGRRKYMEDYHAIFLNEDEESGIQYRFYGVFDGHFGGFAARYAADRLHDIFKQHCDTDCLNDNQQMQQALKAAFQQVDRELLSLHERKIEKFVGGTTATIALILSQSNKIVVASLGDSRAVLCCHEVVEDGIAVQLTVEHVASNETEAAAVCARGGTITVPVENGVKRVNGMLVVTKALGDVDFGNVISAEPDVVIVSSKATTEANQIDNGGNNKLQAITDHSETYIPEAPCSRYHRVLQRRLLSTTTTKEEGVSILLSNNLFLLLASDGVWDVMSNQEAVDMVCTFLASNIEFDEAEDGSAADNIFLFQRVSRLLANEALIRGSSDNVGVIVIDLALKNTDQ